MIKSMKTSLKRLKNVNCVKKRQILEYVDTDYIKSYHYSINSKKGYYLA